MGKGKGRSLMPEAFMPKFDIRPQSAEELTARLMATAQAFEARKRA